jgi:fructosamine-3-kinase
VSEMPDALYKALSGSLGSDVYNVTPLGGGMINQAARLYIDAYCVIANSGSVFLKWKEDAPAGFFAAEAHGLRCLHRAGALRTPKILAVVEAQAGAPAYLALEFIETPSPSDPARFAREFGERLARQHREAVSPNHQFGLDRDNFIGLLPQVNTFTEDWPTFYRECRLMPQVILARKRRLLPPERERLVMQVIERLDTLLADLPAQPVLIHGDLWSGNFLTAGNEPVVIDPSVSYSDREIELAYMELFGGFPPGVLAAYRAAFPLDPGYEYRRPLHQLYPLLNHLNHFGESYGPDVESVCRQYVSG